MFRGSNELLAVSSEPMNLPCFDATFLLVKLSDEIISFKRWISLPLIDGCKVCGFHPRSGTEKIASLLPKAMMGLEDLILTASFWDGGKFLGGNCCSKLPGIRKGFRDSGASPTLSFPRKIPGMDKLQAPNQPFDKRKRWIHIAFFMDVLQKQASRPLDIHQLETPTTPVGEITLPRCLCVHRWQGRDVSQDGALGWEGMVGM